MSTEQMDNYQPSTYREPISVDRIERSYDVNCRNLALEKNNSVEAPDVEMKSYYKALRNPDLTYEEAVLEASRTLNVYRFQFNDERAFSIDDILNESEDLLGGRDIVEGAGAHDNGGPISHNERCRLAVAAFSTFAGYVDDNYTPEQMSVWYINATQASLDVLQVHPYNETGHGRSCTDGLGDSKGEPACRSDDCCPRRELRNALIQPFRTAGENYFGIPYEDDRYNDIVKARLEAALATGVTTIEEEIAFRENRAHDSL